MDDESAMYYNWNRIALLCRKQDLTSDEKEEITMREHFQKNLSCVNTSPEKRDIFKYIKETLTLEVIDSVDLLMKKKVLLQR